MSNENNQNNLNQNQIQTAGAQNSNPIQNLNIVNPPINQNPPNVTTPTQIKKGIPKWIIIEVILLIFLISAVGYYFYVPGIIRKLNSPKTPGIQSQKILPTADWKIFEGKSVGISFKYPSDWQKKENEYVSQIPLSKEDLDENNYSEGKKVKKILNIIRIRRDSKDESLNQFNYTLERFNKMKANPLEKESIEDAINHIKTTKLKQGNISSGEEYILYYRNDYDTESGSGDFNFEAIMIKGQNVIYELTLNDYDDIGTNVLYSIIPTIAISKKPLEPNKYENNYFSINYPAIGEITSEINDINGNYAGAVSKLGKDRRIGLNFIKGSSEFDLPDVIINYTNKNEEYKGIGTDVLYKYDSSIDFETFKNENVLRFNPDAIVENLNGIYKIDVSDYEGRHIILIKNDTAVEFMPTSKEKTNHEKLNALINSVVFK